MLRISLPVFALVFVACSAPAPVPDAGPQKATQSVGAMGGTLELENLRLTLPAGALSAEVVLEVQRSSEAAPVLAGVTALTPVFDFGPDGTQFASEVAVVFTVSPAPVGAELPIVFWTQADGTFAPLPTWWDSEGKVHALTTHLSKAFVGRVTAEPDSLRCCGGVACSGRGVCVAREPLSSDKVSVDGQSFGTLGWRGRMTMMNAAAVLRTATQRKTPVRPFEQGLPSIGGVFDLELEPFEPSEKAELCVEVAATLPLDGTCLGFFDETDSKWKCQDKCLTRDNAYVCGDTGHFTSFAILLTGGSNDRECGR